MNLWSRSRTSGFQWALSQVSPCHGAGSSFMTQRTLEETSALAKQEAEDDRSQCVQRCGFVSWILESPCRSDISKGDQTWWNQCRETLLETDPHEAEELGHCFCQKILSRWPERNRWCLVELVTFGDSVQALVFCSSVPPLHDCPYPELWTDSGIHPEVLETSWNCTEPNSTSNRRCFDDKTMSNSESKHVWYFHCTCHVLDGGAAVWSIKHCKGSDPESEGLRPLCCADPWFSLFWAHPAKGHLVVPDWKISSIAPLEIDAETWVTTLWRWIVAWVEQQFMAGLLKCFVPFLHIFTSSRSVAIHFLCQLNFVAASAFLLMLAAF